jgi:hypothetical protein
MRMHSEQRHNESVCPKPVSPATFVNSRKLGRLSDEKRPDGGLVFRPKSDLALSPLALQLAEHPLLKRCKRAH